MLSHGHILIYTEDAELFLLIEYILEVEGFSVRLCTDREELLTLAAVERPSAVLIDCSGSHADAPTLCRSINRAADGRVRIAAFAQARWDECGRDLNAVGVDVVICRPIEPRRLLAFLGDIRKDVTTDCRPHTRPEQSYSHADIEINVARVRVTRKGHPVRLSALQFRLLLHLMKTPQAVHNREELITAGWPPDVEVEPRTVDVHIGHIRRALNRYGPEVIRTVRSVGYSLDMFSSE
ncbi:MAG: response regulator transcription factor [Rhizobiaceae bacterium]|nr:response regulator transcription factor [Rhizobiaceae bacterium]